jgi:hypothetical protein
MVTTASMSLSTLCIAGSLIAGAASGACADQITDWNQTALRATEIAGVPPPVQARAMSIMHAAMFDAVNAIERKYTVYAIDVKASPGASPEAAAAAAGHSVLLKLYPQQKAITDAAFEKALSTTGGADSTAEGLRVGREAAEGILAQRQNDGAASVAAYEFRTGPGVYQATFPLNAKPVLPHWGALKTFVGIEEGRALLVGPPALDSAAYAKDIEEVRRLGGVEGLARTSAQTAIAIHWAGSEITPLNSVALAASKARGLSLVENARLFALLNMTMSDALVAAFEAKYRFNAWRPITAIRAGASADPASAAWEPLLVTPLHPEYPSAHSLGAGAAVRVLIDVFGGDTFAGSFVYPPLGVIRKWRSFSEIAREVEDARVWAGIHFRTAVEHGTRAGEQIANHALTTTMRRVAAPDQARK